MGQNTAERSLATKGCDMNWMISSPTEPGVYWFQEDGSSRGILGEVRMTNGPWIVLWTNINGSDATLRARWRGPTRKSPAPAGQETARRAYILVNKRKAEENALPLKEAFAVNRAGIGGQLQRNIEQEPLGRLQASCGRFAQRCQELPSRAGAEDIREIQKQRARGVSPSA